MTLFDNPVFKDAVAEIEELGFCVSTLPIPGAVPYGLIGGRSNQRWWLVPLTKSRLTISGLSMFQPIVTSAKFLKKAAVIASKLGLSSVCLKKKIYISTRSKLENIFSEEDLSYAFFTGTDCPHRKVTVQIMSQDGRIRGFAKVSSKTTVKPLLKHEANVLDDLNNLNLQTASIPKVLFYETVGEVEVLVTDSRKTARSKYTTALRTAHVDFINELAEKTAKPTSRGWFIAELSRRYDTVAEHVPQDWRQRFDEALDCLAQKGENSGTKVLSHGDFTPWNTFFVDEHLYVFDWEYSHNGYPVGHDLVHFVFSSPATTNQSVDIALAKVRQLLISAAIDQTNIAENSFLLGYWCAHSLFYFTRAVTSGTELSDWTDKQRSAEFIDYLLAVT